MLKLRYEGEAPGMEADAALSLLRVDINRNKDAGSFL